MKKKKSRSNGNGHAVVDVVKPTYRVDEFAKIIGYSYRTIIRWIKDGDLNAIHVQRTYRIPLSEKIRIQKERTV